MKKIFAVIALLSFVTLANAEVETEEIEYSHNGTKLTGYLAYDDSKSGKRPGVIVVHEWWGHNDHARNRSKMLAEAGYTALALDMYGSGKLANHPKKAGEFMNAAFSNWVDSQARYNKALDIISRREHSEQEITKKLLKKFDTPEVIDRVITKLVANNLINDVRYAQMYVLVRKRKGFGPKKIQFELI